MYKRQTPGSFRFGAPKLEDMATTYQRYDDADLETVTAEIALRRGPMGSNPWWAWILVGAGLALYLAWFFFAKPAEGDAAERDGGLRMPEKVTPFTVLALLEAVRASARLGDEQRAQLDADAHAVEAGHFGKGAQDGAAPDVDLDGIARRWLAAAR